MKNNLFLSFLAILSLILLYSVKSTDYVANKKISLKRPQEYMVKLFVTLFTEEGHLKDQLSAHYWAYLPEKKASTLTQPRLTVFRPDGTSWHIQAKHGFVTQPDIGTLKEITLQEQVILERPDSALATAITIKTEEVSYDPKRNFAQSSRFVTLTKPGLQITGTGLRAFLDNSSVELLRDVKTYYTVTH